MFPAPAPYEIGDEIWQQTLREAIPAEAEIVAEDADRTSSSHPTRNTAGSYASV